MRSTKSIVLVISIVVLGSLGCQTETGPTFADADRAAIEKVVADSVTTGNSPDLDWGEYVDGYYTADGVLLPPNAPAIKGRAALLSFFESYPPFSDLKFTVIQIVGVGNQAWVWGSYSMTMFPDTNPVEDVGSYVEIWSRRPDGSWRVALDIFNSDIPPHDERPPGE
jgi:ketosteroid isomerase-like protein